MFDFGVFYEKAILGGAIIALIGMSIYLCYRFWQLIEADERNNNDTRRD